MEAARSRVRERDRDGGGGGEAPAARSRVRERNRDGGGGGEAPTAKKAISLKEEQLIGNVAMYPEMSQEESGHQIRFVNPKVYNDGESTETNGLDKDCIKTGQDDVQETENLHLDFEELSIKENSSIDTSHHGNMADKLNGISSYEDFLQYVDGQLQKVESDLVMFLKLSTLMLENKEKLTSSKVQQTSGLLKDIRSTRERVASIIKEQLDDKAI